MRILLLCHSFNSLSQRLFVELRRDGHDLSVELDISPAVTIEAVGRFRPNIVLAPFLRRAIPEEVWRHTLTFVVHPGPAGDRGPNALDWAILDDLPEWGVTVLQANADFDAGPVRAQVPFAMRAASKSSLYRREVTEAALTAVRAAIADVAAGRTPSLEPVTHRWRGSVPQASRAIDWIKDDTQTVLRKIRSADGSPGLRQNILGQDLYLYGASPAAGIIGGVPGEVIARSGEAIALATHDGAVWIESLRDPTSSCNFKLPATTVLKGHLQHIVEIAPAAGGHSPVRYRQQGKIGFLDFAFRNGAMSSQDCRDLLAAYRQALLQDTSVLVLLGGAEFWSNGMDLYAIEAAVSPADESWANIQAIDDLAEAILRTTDRLTIAALQGNAGAGGVFLARAADEVWAQEGVILNPHYKDMGNLYGSEFWTYLLPNRIGMSGARRIVEMRLPMGVHEAQETGLVDRVLPGTDTAWCRQVEDRAVELAEDSQLPERLRQKADQLARHEAIKPLRQYRTEELAEMHKSFFGFDQSYHVARFNFVTKVPKSRTPATIAFHRRMAPNPVSTRLAI
jgi:putative two-component system hydrogenase maturation factor HypX/HoxX